MSDAQQALLLALPLCAMSVMAAVLIQRSNRHQRFSAIVVSASVFVIAVTLLWPLFEAI